MMTQSVRADWSSDMTACHTRLEKLDNDPLSLSKKAETLAADVSPNERFGTRSLPNSKLPANVASNMMRASNGMPGDLAPEVRMHSYHRSAFAPSSDETTARREWTIARHEPENS